MENEIVDVLYGSQCEKRHCCGYCKRKGKYLTPRQLRKHECLGKQCPYLDKLEHQMWAKRDKKLQEKKQKKIASYQSTPSFLNDVAEALTKALGYDAYPLVRYGI